MAPAALRPLRHRSFALLWTGGMISNTGTWMQTVAVGSLIKASTGRDSLVAVAAVASFLPIGLLSPVGGALADRIARKRFLVAMSCLEAALAGVLALAAATGRAGVATVTALVLVEGCASALRFPFQQALLPDLVPADDLLGAVALGSAQYNIGRIVGPAVGAVVIATSSIAAAFAANAASFLAVTVAVALIRIPPPPPPDEHGVLRRILQGAAVARAEPGCRAALILVAVMSFTVAPFIALVAGRAGDLVGGGERALARATGAVTTAQGVGAVVGALLLPSLAARLGRRRTLLANLVAAPVLVTVYAWAPSVPTAVAAMVPLGMAYVGILSGLQAVVQLRAPAEVRGRVLSLFFVALGTLYPLGALWQGALGDVVGLTTATTVGAGAALVILLVVAVGRPGLLRSLEAP